MATLYHDVYGSIERRRKQDEKDAAEIAKSTYALRTHAELAVLRANSAAKTARRGKKIRGRRPNHADGRTK